MTQNESREGGTPHSIKFTFENWWCFSGRVVAFFFVDHLPLQMECVIACLLPGNCLNLHGVPQGV